MTVSDWAAWSQFGAILFTGFGAVFVADRQLSAYNKGLSDANANERLRNTLKSLDDMRTPTQLSGVKISPLDANVELLGIARSPDKVNRYATYLNRVRSNDSSAASDAAFVSRTDGLVQIALFYYLDAWTLISRKIVDEPYMMSKLGPFVTSFAANLNTLKNEHAANPVLKSFIEKAQAYDKILEATSK